MLNEEIKAAVRKYAVKNALDYGKADEKAVMNKVISKLGVPRGEIGELAALSKEIVERVNNADRSALEREFEDYRKDFEEEGVEKAKRSAQAHMELGGAVTGNFATRFSPEPGGYMHIGHAKISLMESEFAKMYDGKLFLYFDDTNPEKERQEFVDAIKRDAEWLGLEFSGEYYASDNIEKLYAYAESMINGGNAYVDLCSLEAMKRGRANGAGCMHKSQDAARNMELWKDMLGGRINEDGGVLRLNFKMDCANTALRDPTLFRIKEHAHYRQGDRYRVWPTYDFNTPIIDSIKGITDAIRSKEYELRDESYYMMLDLLGLRKPRVHSIARLEIKNNITSKRKLTSLIEDGLVSGYDDPRLVTIAGLRRRGITKEAIRKFVLRFGTSLAESEVGMDMLLSENRKIIDKDAVHLFMVEDPVLVKINGAGRRKVRIGLSPYGNIGYREYDVGNEIYIARADSEGLHAGDVVRLKDLDIVRITAAGSTGIECTISEETPAKTLHWVDAGNNVECRIWHISDLLLNGEFNKGSIRETRGHAEPYVRQMRLNQITQFERVGFFKLDDLKDFLFIAV